jgi:hypothetical protein
LISFENLGFTTHNQWRTQSNYLLHYDEVFKEEKDAFDKTKVFFSFFFFLHFKVFVSFVFLFLLSNYFFGLQKFHESLIDLLLLLRGAIDGVSSHAGIGGELCHF